MKPSSLGLLPQHLPSLDGIRGLAIALVVVFNTKMLEAPQSILAKASAFAMDRGWVGVQLFFVLSGFLISGILIDTKQSPNYYRSFFVRRALRIFPLYYLTLLVMLLLPMLGMIEMPSGLTWADQIPLWFYFSNWTAPYGWGGNNLPHFWSLAVEEQYYLVWPFILHRLDARQTLKLCILIAIASLAIRIFLLLGSFSPDAVYSFSVCRMDALALGSAAAAIVRMPNFLISLRKRQGMLLLTIITVSVIGAIVTRCYERESFIGQTIGYSLLSVIFTLLIMAAVSSDLKNIKTHSFSFLRWFPLCTLGKYSYGIYVFHKPLHDLVGKYLLTSFNLQVADDLMVSITYTLACLLTSLLLAMLSYHAFESHFLGLKRYFVANR